MQDGRRARSRSSSTPRTGALRLDRGADAHDLGGVPRGGDVSFVVEELKAVVRSAGRAVDGGRYVPSLLAAIGGVIERHLVENRFSGASGPAAHHRSRRAAPAIGRRVTGAGRRGGGRSAGGARQCPNCGAAALTHQEGLRRLPELRLFALRLAGGAPLQWRVHPLARRETRDWSRAPPALSRARVGFPLTCSRAAHSVAKSPTNLVYSRASSACRRAASTTSYEALDDLGRLVCLLQFLVSLATTSGAMPLGPEMPTQVVGRELGEALLGEGRCGGIHVDALLRADGQEPHLAGD